MEKPLNVRVAEALGCTPVYGTYKVSPETPYERTEGPLWRCLCPKPEETEDDAWHVERVPSSPRHIERGCGRSLEVARYDVSWFATGPLIERYGFATWLVPANVLGPAEWRACLESTDEGSFSGPTLLVAVCKLIVALSEAGKLKSVE
jgi:hypothetical protein